MDAPSKLFILMMTVALIFGWIVLKVVPEYKQEAILQSNNQNNYYPSAK